MQNIKIKEREHQNKNKVLLISYYSLLLHLILG